MRASWQDAPWRNDRLSATVTRATRDIPDANASAALPCARHQIEHDGFRRRAETVAGGGAIRCQFVSLPLRVTSIQFDFQLGYAPVTVFDPTYDMTATAEIRSFSPDPNAGNNTNSRTHHVQF
jgi:hypothetical protein